MGKVQYFVGATLHWENQTPSTTWGIGCTAERLEVMNCDGQASYVVLAGGCTCWKSDLHRDPWITWKGRSDFDLLSVVKSLSSKGLWGSVFNQLLQRYGRRGNGVPQLIVVLTCLHNFLLCLEWHLAEVLVCSLGFVLSAAFSNLQVLVVEHCSTSRWNGQSVEVEALFQARHLWRNLWFYPNLVSF